MKKRLSEIGEGLRKSLESQPKYWFVIVVSLVVEFDIEVGHSCM
jgi:hypothetical protein